MPWYRAAITTESEYGQTLMCIPLESGDHYTRKPVVSGDIEGVLFVFLLVLLLGYVSQRSGGLKRRHETELISVSVVIAVASLRATVV